MRTLEYLAVTAIALGMAYFVATAAVGTVTASLQNSAVMIERAGDGPR